YGLNYRLSDRWAGAPLTVEDFDNTVKFYGVLSCITAPNVTRIWETVMEQGLSQLLWRDPY
ncbi:MAG: hypothetical protein ACRDBM_07530, partial [Sporomusa sp.]